MIHRTCRSPFLAILFGTIVLTPVWADRKSSVLDKPVPENVKDLRAIQKRVRTVLDHVIPCTVAVRIGSTGGSGVVISKDGYVLTAGHISGKPGRDVVLTFPNGRTVKGKTLGSNRDIDSGMIRITDKGDWPFVEMGDSAKVKLGEWCLTLGHPDGFKRGRTPVVRLGRVLERSKQFLRTDCPLVGGDSGGPLFDLNGKVIGIHSRIGPPLTHNIHVPANTFRTTWDRLTKSEVWGGPKTEIAAAERRTKPYIGVEIIQRAKTCRIAKVERNSPAAKAGLQIDDVLLRLNKKVFDDVDDLIARIGEHKPGDEVLLEIRRGEEVRTLKVIVGAR